MKKIYTTLTIVALGLSSLSAQGVNKLFNKASGYASDFGIDLEQQINGEDSPEDKPSLQEWECPKCGHSNLGGNRCLNCGKKNVLLNIAQWGKYEFVCGDSVIFEDFKEGQDPLYQWIIINGEANVTEKKKAACLNLIGATITPVSPDGAPYLTDQFSYEFDIYLRHEKQWESEMHQDYAGWGPFTARFMSGDSILGDGTECFEISMETMMDGEEGDMINDVAIDYKWFLSGEQRSGSFTVQHAEYEGWHHIAIAFDKRNVRIYFDERRIANINNVRTPKWLIMNVQDDSENLFFIKDTRIAVGFESYAEQLANNGKIETKNIRYEDGEIMFNLESMGIINRVTRAMKDNQGLMLEISCPGTDGLQKRRAETIIAALAARGIDKSRLAASADATEGNLVIFEKR